MCCYTSTRKIQTYDVNTTVQKRKQSLFTQKIKATLLQIDVTRYIPVKLYMPNFSLCTVLNCSAVLKAAGGLTMRNG